MPWQSTSFTDASTTIPTAGAVTTVSVMGERIEVTNPHPTAVLWCRWGASPAANGAGSFPIVPEGQYGDDGVNGTLYILATVNNQPVTINKWS